MPALLAIPAVRWALLGLALAAAIGLAVLWIRRDAAQDARNEIAAEAAVKQEETRHEAEGAARAAERDGAERLLHDGRF